MPGLGSPTRPAPPSCPRVEAIDRSRPSTRSSPPPLSPPMVPRVEALDRGRPPPRRYRTRPGPAGPQPRASIRVSAHDRPNLSETNSRGSIRFRPTGRRATERGNPACGVGPPFPSSHDGQIISRSSHFRPGDWFHVRRAGSPLNSSRRRPSRHRHTRCSQRLVTGPEPEHAPRLPLGPEHVPGVVGRYLDRGRRRGPSLRRTSRRQPDDDELCGRPDRARLGRRDDRPPAGRLAKYVQGFT